MVKQHKKPAWEQDNAMANAETDKKCARVVPINPAEIVDENGNPIDLQDTTTLSKWLLKKYQGHKVDVIDDGRSVAFARKGLEASLKKRGDGHREMYADLESLIENGVYAGYEKGDGKHDNVDRQNIYYAAAAVNGQVYGIRFKVDIFKGYEAEAGKYKDHKIAEVDIEKSPFLYVGFNSYQPNGDSSQSPPLCQDGRHGDVALQKDSDFSIAIPKIRQAFINKSNTFSSKSQELPKKMLKKSTSPLPTSPCYWRQFLHHT